MSTQRILVPTDLSEYSDAALRYAAMLRDRLGLGLTVVFADEPGFPVNMPEMPLAVKERSREEQKRVADIVRRHVEEVVPPPVPEIRTAFGSPSDVILKTAAAIDASMIVMGTRGRRGFSRMMVGSITESVLEDSLRPVLTLGPAAMGEQPAAIRKILCPVNFSFVALEAMRMAAEIASQCDAELIILYVAEEKQPPLTEELERELATWVDPHLGGRTRYRQMVATGQAAEQVLQMVDEIPVDLLVIGAQHRMFRDSTVIGATTERLVRFARIPVLTVPRAEE
jgi:nucleotide-binding universal stress UspA family protein